MFGQLFNNIPPVIKNLLIINVLMFIAALSLENQGINLWFELGMNNFMSDNFRPYQLITYMFMHGGVAHLFFNMFALIMFGAVLERIWGPQRFLMFYFITGIGAVVLYSIIGYFEYTDLVSRMTTEEVERIKEVVAHPELIGNGIRVTAEGQSLYEMLSIPMVGASGAIFGILVAFGLLFPNTELMLIFFPVPIKAKYFIPGYILIELYLGVMQFSGDNVAHFAHLGGALIGFILLKLWQKDKNRFY